MLLRQQPDLPAVEQSSKNPSLNRDLYKCIRKVCNSQTRLRYHLLVYEGQNLPGQGDKPAESERKRPDFYWHIANHLAGDDEAELRFVLECKRLGTPERSGENFELNKNYARKGILRFLMSSHEYGKGDDEGGMIGYVQSMEFADILEEINQTARENPVSITGIPLPPDGWVKDGISEMGHVLERPFPISPFRLRHFWVDIRRS